MRLCERCGACFDDNFDLCGFDGGALTTLFEGARVIGERYLLEQRVAGGAMGIVLRATHLQVGSTVAVKLMRPAQDGMHVALTRFHREAQILGQIKHPNAVLVIDFGIERRGPESVPFLVMEFLRGESLLAVLEKEKQLSLAAVEKIVSPLCDAVEEAHEVGVIHRDLKPGNVVLEKLRDGSQIVKVLDFGIAKFVSRGKAPASGDAGFEGIARTELEELLASDEDDVDQEQVGFAEPHEDAEDPLDDDDFLTEVLMARAGASTSAAPRPVSLPDGGRDARDPTTEAGFMIGTIPYMAPEQMTGQRVSRRTDVHAIGVLTFELLAGRLPYDGDDEDIIAAKLSDERPSLRELGVTVPAALDELLMKTFALDPNERPASVREIAGALRAALLQRGPHTTSAAAAIGTVGAGDVTMETVVQLGAVTRALKNASAAVDAWLGAPAARGADSYERARDQLLVLDGLLRRARVLVHALPGPLAAEQRTNVAIARDDLEDHSGALRRGLARTFTGAGARGEFGEYLGALWARQDLFVQEIVDVVSRLTDPSPNAESPLFLAQMFAPEESPSERTPQEIAQRLLTKDPLDAADAVDELLEHQIDTVVRTLQSPPTVGAATTSGDISARLLEGMWHHADALLLHELQPGRRGFRLLPFLARLPEHEGARPFALLARAFAASHLDDAGAQALFADLGKADRGPLARCLLVHPSEAARAFALASLPLSDLWSVIAHPATPPAALRFVFSAVKDRAPNEYLKIFFFCAKDNLRATSSAADLRDALQLVELFFEVPCFHEDIVFEPLLELERAVRQRTALVGVADEARYAERLAAFTAAGVSETRPLESVRDVPLPIQRKLAREGHFLNYFVSHANDRVARETLPHLFRLEDITAFLRIPTIHRIVLTELARKKRFFKKEPAKLALLTNPKLPAVIARLFLPLVSHDQLRILSTNKHINPDVRKLILTSLTK